MNEDTREAVQDAWNRWGCLGTLGLAFLLLLVGGWILKRDLSPRVGADVRSVAFLDREGRLHTLAQFSGKVVVVDVWATWCPPCKASLPELAELQATSDHRYVVLPISVDENGFKAVTPFLAQQSGVLKDLKAYVPAESSALDPFGPINGIPTTLIVGADGKLRTRWSGFSPGRTSTELKRAMGIP